jgi:ribonuclease-3
MKSVLLKLRRFFSTKKNLERSDGDDEIAELEAKLGYQFSNRELLRLALTHRSYLAISGESHLKTNERLEFLGDSVLGLLVTEYLYEHFPRKSEGILTQYKSILVSRRVLARHARNLGLGRFLFLGTGEERSGGRRRESILADAFEAIVGAVYLDGGYNAAREFLFRTILNRVQAILKEEIHRNYKSQLLEYTQAKGMGMPEYEVCSERGPEHAKVFEVSVKIRGQVLGVGVGTSKKRAEQQAARIALEALKEEETE